MSWLDFFLPDPSPKKKTLDTLLNLPGIPHNPASDVAWGLIKEALSDPETDGKKAGYARAAKEYKSVFQAQKRHYKQIIQAIEIEKQACDKESSELISRLQKLEQEKHRLQQKLEAQRSATADKFHISNKELQTTFSGPSYSWATNDPLISIGGQKLLEWIHDKRRASYEKEGYAEAAALYNNKLSVLRNSFENQKNELNGKLREYSDLIAEALHEIEVIRIEIANLKLLQNLGEDE